MFCKKLVSNNFAQVFCKKLVLNNFAKFKGRLRKFKNRRTVKNRFMFKLPEEVICTGISHFERKKNIERHYTAWKVSEYGVISGPYFPVFRLNTKIYGVNLRNQSEYRKIRTRQNFVFGHFSSSDYCVARIRVFSDSFFPQYWQKLRFCLIFCRRKHVFSYITQSVHLYRLPNIKGIWQNSTWKLPSDQKTLQVNSTLNILRVVPSFKSLSYF